VIAGEPVAAKPPIMLIHGACSQPAHMAPWRRFFVSQGYRCVVPPLPGHAPTDRCALAGLGIDDYLTAVLAERTNLTQPPIVIGHSMGGLLAQMLAVRTECAGIVLVASLADGFVPVTLRALPYFMVAAPRVLAGRPFRPLRAGLRSLTLHHLPRRERELLLDDFVMESGRAYRQMLFGRARLGARRFDCPVLVVGGALDRLVPPLVTRMIAKRHAAEMIMIADHGHWLIAASLLDRVADPVLNWIRRLDSGGRHPSLRRGQPL
jgi:pimeloyl-ACP methyl ester carboxylesterase